MSMRCGAASALLSTVLVVTTSCVLSLAPLPEETDEAEESEGEGRPNSSDAAEDEGDSESAASTPDAETSASADGDEESVPWCESTRACDEGHFCWADYGQGNGDAPDTEDFACHDDCVPTDNPDSMVDAAEGYWCADDASCCSPEASCGAMGYCTAL